MSETRIALMGLGIMGGGMARRLLARGFPLTVFNRNPEKCRPLAAEGARVAETPREAASLADVVFVMVADDNASRSIWLGESGALAGARPGTICVECSTLSVGWVRELAREATARKCEFLDAPVTGSKGQAAAGELKFLVGGAEATLERVRPALDAMGTTILPAGHVGNGALLKLINNFVCGVQLATLAEAMTVIERSGLDRRKAVSVLTGGAPGSPLVKGVSARMMTEDYTPNFLLRLMSKDLRYAIEEALHLSVDLRTARAALGEFDGAVAAGHGEKDIAAVVELLRAEHIER